MENVKWYGGNGPTATVRHISTGETYPALLLEAGVDSQYIFEITGDRAHCASCLCESDDLVVDTWFEKWEVLKIHRA